MTAKWIIGSLLLMAPLPALAQSFQQSRIGNWLIGTDRDGVCNAVTNAGNTLLYIYAPGDFFGQPTPREFRMTDAGWRFDERWSVDNRSEHIDGILTSGGISTPFELYARTSGSGRWWLNGSFPDAAVAGMTQANRFSLKVPELGVDLSFDMPTAQVILAEVDKCDREFPR